LTEKFIREHEPLLFTLVLALKKAMETGQAVDFDAREALEALIRTCGDLGVVTERIPGLSISNAPVGNMISWLFQPCSTARLKRTS
jgi:hypothetical protein